MVGIAAIIVFIYLICFSIIHIKDIKHYDYETHTSFYGESCYDPSYLTGNWKFHWEQHYYETLYFKLYDKIPLPGLEPSTPEEALKESKTLENLIKIRIENAKKENKTTPYIDDYGNFIHQGIKDFLLENINFEELKEQAKTDAARDINDWNSTINYNRKREYHEDFKENAIYATIISLLTMILGRYLLKLIKWTNINKTK